MNSFKTISAFGESLFKSKGSKFHGLVFPVLSLLCIKNSIVQAQMLYPAATHYCFAYRLIENNRLEERASDDGEPFNSSGPPILRAIEALDLINVLVIVVRYYGGKKLGVAGLKDSYGEAARMVLNDSTIINKNITINVWLKHTIPSKQYEIYNIISKLNLNLISNQADKNGYFCCELDKENEQVVKKELEKLYTIESNFKPIPD